WACPRRCSHASTRFGPHSSTAALRDSCRSSAAMRAAPSPLPPRSLPMHPLRSDRLVAALLALGLLVPAFASAAGPPASPVAAIRDQWAQVAYVTPKAQRASAFEALAGQSAKVLEARPKDADALIWDGIVRSSLAG